MEIPATVRATNHHILAICCSTKSWKWFQVTQQLRTPRVLLLQLYALLWQYHNGVKYFLRIHCNFFATAVWSVNDQAVQDPPETHREVTVVDFRQKDQISEMLLLSLKWTIDIVLIWLFHIKIDRNQPWWVSGMQLIHCHRLHYSIRSFYGKSAI